MREKGWKGRGPKAHSKMTLIFVSLSLRYSLVGFRPSLGKVQMGALNRLQLCTSVAFWALLCKGNFRRKMMTSIGKFCGQLMTSTLSPHMGAPI